MTMRAAGAGDALRHDTLCRATPRPGDARARTQDDGALPFQSRRSEGTAHCEAPQFGARSLPLRQRAPAPDASASIVATPLPFVLSPPELLTPACRRLGRSQTSTGPERSPCTWPVGRRRSCAYLVGSARRCWASLGRTRCMSALRHGSPPSHRPWAGPPVSGPELLGRPAGNRDTSSGRPGSPWRLGRSRSVAWCHKPSIPRSLNRRLGSVRASSKRNHTTHDYKRGSS